MKRAFLSAFLLLVVSLILAGGAWFIFSAQHNPDFTDPRKGIYILLGAFWAGWAFTAFRRGDTILVPLVSCMCTIGWLELYRLGPMIEDPSLSFKHACHIAAGFACFIFITLFLRDYRRLEDYKYSFLVGGILIQLPLLFLGIKKNGAALWYDVGGISIQPGEFVKICIVLFLAGYLHQFRNWIRLGLRAKNKDGALARSALFKLGLGMACAECIYVKQSDLGMALILFMVFIAVFYIATGRKDILIIASVMSAFGARVCYLYYNHVRERVDIWLDPFKHFENEGYQICQALFALANGGLDGTGLGMGEPYLVPIPESDFMFVALCEELGLIGGVAVLALIIMLCARCFRISLASSDIFGTLAAGGFAALLASQAIVVIYGVLKMMPMTGVTLPFMCAGGCSIVSCFIILGLLWCISAEAKYGD